MTSKKCILIILALTDIYLLTGQSRQEQIDSLIKVVPTVQDEHEKARLLNKISFAYCIIDPAKGIEYGKQALQVAESMSDPKERASAYNNLASNSLILQNTDDAKLYYEKAYEINLEQNDQVGQAQNLGNLGLYYYYTGKYDSSLEYLFKALKLFETLKDSMGIANQLSAIGNVYSDQNNHNKAIYYDSLALLKFEAINDEEGVALTLGNIGNLYYSLNDADKAIPYLLLAIEKYEKINLENGVARNLINLSNSYNIKKNYRESLEILKRALAIYKKQGDQTGMGYCIGNIGNCYYLCVLHATDKDTTVKLMAGTPDEHLNLAIKYLEESVKLNQQANTLAPIIYFSQQLANCYERKGDFKNALKYYKLYSVTQDTVYSNESKVTIEKLTTEREVELKNKQIEINRLEVLKKRNERIYFIIAMGLLSLALLFIYQNYSNQKRSNAELGVLNNQISITNSELEFKNETLSTTLQNLKETQEQLIETEKQKENAVLRSRISQDIHDDISSGLTKISWLAEMVKAKSTVADAQLDLGLIDKINGFSRETVSKLGEIIWSTNPERDNLESLLAYLRNFTTKYLEDTSFKYTLDFPEQLPDNAINPELRRNLFLVVKEALNNAVKYSRAKHIGISLSLTGNQYQFTVSDDGAGIDEGVIKGGGNGMNNMRKRMEAVKGQFNLQSSSTQGTVISFAGQLY
jgi:signal transduction histidine kinase